MVNTCDCTPTLLCRGSTRYNSRAVAELAEDTIVEGRLELVRGAARADGGVRPVHLVRLANFHVDAVLPVVLLGELLVVLVVVAALVAEASAPLRRADGARRPARPGGGGGRRRR